MNKEEMQDLEIDKDVKEELEDTNSEDLLIELMRPGDDNGENIRFLDKWFPQSDTWEGKTNIEAPQAHSLAVLRSLEHAFPRMPDYAKVYLKNLIEEYEIYLTSIDGRAREQQVDILMAMFGKDKEDRQAERMRDAIFADAQSEDND